MLSPVLPSSWIMLHTTHRKKINSYNFFNGLFHFNLLTKTRTCPEKEENSVYSNSLRVRAAVHLRKYMFISITTHSCKSFSYAVPLKAFVCKRSGKHVESLLSESGQLSQAVVRLRWRRDTLGLISVNRFSVLFAVHILAFGKADTLCR